MTLYISNRDGNGKTDEKGHYKFPSVAFAGNVVLPGLAVTQNSPLGMSVIVNTGDFRIETSQDYAYTGWNGSPEVLTIATADSANPRIDTVVAYVDKNAPTSALPPNNPGIAKFKVITGTPNGIPTAPNGSTIQTSVGANNPYITIADIRVNALASTITNANITGQRIRARIADNFVTTDSILDNALTTSKIADSQVSMAKLQNGAVTTAKFRPTIINSNFTPAASRYSTSTVGTFAIPNCSMNYTAGPTNETLFLWTEGMANKSTSGNGEMYLYVNGVEYGTSAYIDFGSPWYRISFLNIVNVNAGATINLSVRVRNASTTALSVTNETDRWVPTIQGFSIYRP